MTKQTILKEALILFSIYTVSLLLLTLPSILQGLVFTPEAYLLALLMPLAVSIIIYLGVLLYRKLKPLTGPITAFALMSALSALTSFAVAIALPACPQSTISNMVEQTGRCDVYAAADWAFIMSLLVVLAGLIVFTINSTKAGLKTILGAYKILWNKFISKDTPNGN